MEVSIIIPNYNHAAFLTQRIGSVLSQTFTDYELILLDDASTDESKAILSQYSSHPKVSHLVFNETNSGSPFKQWMKGISLAKGNWIWIAESDDEADPRFLEAAMHQIAATENTGLYYCNSAVETNNQPDTTTADICTNMFGSSTWEKQYVVSGIEEINSHLKFRSSILNASSVLFKKKIFTGKNIRAGDFRYYGDWYIYLNMLPGSGIIYDPATYNKFRRTARSHSQMMDIKNKVTIKKECFMILYLLIKMPEVTNKRHLINWFVQQYTGFGIRSDGLRLIGKLVVTYYSINFRLATIVIIKSFLSKLKPGIKK